MVDVGISESVEDQDGRGEGLRHVDDDLAGGVGHGALALPLRGVEGFVVVGVGEDDEEDDRDDKEDGRQDNAGDDDAPEGLEGEPGLVAQPLEPTVLSALHLNRYVR
jgi:hypothetical protein